MKKLIKISLLTLASISLSVLASGGGSYLPNDEMPTYTSHRLTTSMQNGMQVYMNNCMGCHSLEFQRYNRTAKDLVIPEDLMISNLMFSSDKIGDLMTNNMPTASAEKWFGTAPPDLSLIARSRKPQWLYNYFRGFYQDDSRPYGVNNSVFKDVGMPHALESLQGIQAKTDEVKNLENEKEYALGDLASAQEKLKNEEGDSSELNALISKSEALIHENDEKLMELSESGNYFTLVKQGQLSPAEFDSAMTDLVNFLDYIGEPIKRERKSMGVYVLLFILFFTAVAYFLKKEYWKDIH
ncbi:MAG: cytochrome c1 [Kangiellaceae bacterium]|nr:cytochrome c1 [Kangiellaceae bacterium]